LAEVGELGGELFEVATGGGAAGDGAGAGDGLDFPEHGASAVIVLVGGEGIDEEAFFAVGAEAGVGWEGDAVGGVTGEEFHDLGGEFLEWGQVTDAGVGDEDDIEIGTVGEFGSAEFSESDDGEGGEFASVSAHDGLEGILEAGVGEVGEFLEIEFEVGEAEDIAEAEAHELGRVVAADPGELVFVLGAVLEFGEDLGGVFAAAQVATEHQVFHEVGGADGGFGEEFRAIEEEDEEVEDGGVAGPGFVEHGA